MPVDLQLEHPTVSREELEELLEGLLRDGVEVVVVDPGVMRVLNRTYRHVDAATDVLTFDLSDGPGGPPEGVIYVDGRLAPPLSDLLERILHGWLHLRGATHDTEADAAAMGAEVSALVARCLHGRGET